ncbi:MAG: hypothetical protein IPJ40_08655 [Saprospirales bacterium]|nr:hypothetical protein [Saprospirales bacterium]
MGNFTEKSGAKLTTQTKTQKEEIQKNLDDLAQKEADLQISLKVAQEATDTAEVRRIEAELATILANKQTRLAESAKILADQDAIKPKRPS